MTEITPLPSRLLTEDDLVVMTGLLERVVDRVDSGQTVNDVLISVINWDMQAWKIGEWDALAVTRIAVMPKWKCLVVAYLAGDGMDEWFHDLMDVLEEYAHANHCRHVEVWGRRGWKKVGASRGYEECMTVMRKVVNG